MNSNYQCCGYVFATLAEASALSEYIRKKTNTVYEVTATEKAVTHSYDLKGENT